MLKKGCLTKNEQYTNIYILLIDMLITGILTVILAFTKIQFYLKISIPLAVLLFIYILASNYMPKNRNLKKLVKNFHKTCDFNSFDDKYERYVSNDLDPDTLTYLKLMRTNILYSINKEKAISDFSKIEKPKSAIAEVYAFLEMMNAIYSNKLDEAQMLVRKAKSNNQVSKNDISNIELLIKVYSAKEVIKDIENIYKVNTKAKFYNLINMNILMNYYDLRCDNKAKVYAEMILNSKTELYQYNNDSEKIINKYK